MKKKCKQTKKVSENMLPPDAVDKTPDMEKEALMTSNEFMSQRKTRSQKFSSSLRRQTTGRRGGLPKSPRAKKL